MSPIPTSLPDSAPIPAELLSRYVAGACDDSERATVERWLAGDPARDGIVRGFTQPAGAEHEDATRAARAAWEQFHATRLAEPALQRSSQRRLRMPGTAVLRKPSLFRTPIPYVITGTVVLAAIAMFFGHTPAPTVQREYVTGHGEHAMIRLTDGTSIVLSAGSRLRYEPFGKGVRNVYVEGEAHFTVTPSTSSPFVVYTAHAATQVLGTTFIVREYPGDSITRVVVSDGKVALRSRKGDNGTGTTLTRGDMGHIDAAGLAAIARGVNTDHYTSWMRGTLTFSDARLGDAITEIERWYDVEIVLADPALATASMTGALTAQSADEAITRITEVLNLRSVRKGRVVTLSPKRP